MRKPEHSITYMYIRFDLDWRKLLSVLPNLFIFIIAYYKFNFNCCGTTLWFTFSSIELQFCNKWRKWSWQHWLWKYSRIQNKVCKWTFLCRMLMYFILVDTFRCYIISYQSHDAERSGSYVSLSVSVNGSWKVYFRPFLFQHIFSSVKMCLLWENSYLKELNFQKS